MNISTQSSVLKCLISNSLRKSAGSSERSERARDKKISSRNRHPLDLTFVGHCSCWESLRNYEPDSFDVALLFDGSRKDTRKIREEIGIPSRKLLPLW